MCIKCELDSDYVRSSKFWSMLQLLIVLLPIRGLLLQEQASPDNTCLLLVVGLCEVLLLFFFDSLLAGLRARSARLPARRAIAHARTRPPTRRVQRGGFTLELLNNFRARAFSIQYTILYARVRARERQRESRPSSATDGAQCSRAMCTVCRWFATPSLERGTLVAGSRHVVPG